MRRDHGRRRPRLERGLDEGDEETPLAPPDGLRVLRSMVGDTEYAVLALPAQARAEASASLTEAERQVVDLVLAGLSNDAIAARRGTSARTVANQLQSIYRKLGVASRLELVTALRSSS